MRTKQYRVELSEAERAELTLLIGRGAAPARTIRRAHILLAAADDWFDADVAAALHTSPDTVHRVRRRFAEAPADERLPRALYDRPRPGAAPKLDAKAEARLVALACSKPPAGHAVWTLQLLADALVELRVIDGISDETVRRTLGKKSAQAVAGRPLVHRAGGRGLRLAHGGRARPLHRRGAGD
jgi:hypothetical protein